MEETNVKICRLCLTVIEGTNFQIVEALRIEMLKTILVNIDLSITTGPIICCNCADILQKCFKFKRACLDTENRVKSFVTNISEPTKVNLADMYFKQFFKNDQICIRQKICRLCFNLDSTCYTDVNINLENRSLQDLLNNCVPEVNLDLTNEPLVCQLCVELLIAQFTFMLDCLEIEKKIKMFCNLKSCNDSYFVDLNNIRQYFEGIKTEICIEAQLSHFRNITHLKLEEEFINTEFDCGMLKYEELNMPENVEIKDECNSENESSGREEKEMNLPQHEEMQSKGIVEQRHLKSVNVNSQKKLSCPKCNFTAKYKSRIKNHMISHKSPSEVMMFRCSFCDYEGKRKSGLKQHLHIHSLANRNPSEINMFRCNLCHFETKQKRYLKDHMIKHRNIPDSEMFKCAICEFKCKRKSSLNKHMLLHNNSLKAIFKCAECNYLAKTKHNLKSHERIHKDISEVETFKCNECDYQSRWKENLKGHILRHNLSGVVYKCEKCNFSTKILQDITKHGRIHRHESGVPIFKCNDCSFQSWSKKSLREHILTHIRKKMKKSEVPTFKCNDCSFQSMWKKSLRKHILTHIRKKMKNTNC